MTRLRRTLPGVAALVAVSLALAGAIQTVVQAHAGPVHATTTATAQSAPIVERPLDNNCSAGYVTFTFDDGPRENTEKVLDALDGFGINAVFFWNGRNVKGREPTVARAVAEGNVIGNHTWDHADMTTGELPDGTRATWSAEWLRSELEQANEALMAAGAPRPTLYRPPYGAINKQVDEVAKELGLRLVMPWGYDGEDNIVDSHDSEGDSSQEIVDLTIPWIRADSIITMHDAQGQETFNTIGALQGIVDAMNKKGLCATPEVRADATGRVLDMYG